MMGPRIIVDALSGDNVFDKKRKRWWQYHSRSDHHSKVACGAILLDLLAACPLLQRHASEGKVAFGLNHEMRDFRSSRKKDLDFVLCRPAGPLTDRTLEDVALGWKLQGFDPGLARILKIAPVGAVLVAMEAKACMTAHVKALPRLYDELNSSQQTIHGAAHEALAAGFVMINAASSFVTPSTESVNPHDQPRVAARTVAKMRELPRRSKIDEDGYDALGIMLIDLKNDGSPATLVQTRPAPQPNDTDFYDRMIDRLATLYASRFKEL